jgi:hypothetical protein
MMKPGVRPLALAVLLGSLLLAGAAHAVTYTVTVPLSGANENPPNGSAATGTATLTIDTDANTIGYNITHTVVGPTGAHIHGPAARDKNAGVIVNFGASTSPIVGSVAYTEGTVEAPLMAGRTYVNIHGQPPFGGGEIRGQVPAAPSQAPGLTEWGMVALALALVLFGTVLVSRRRRLMT